MADKTYYAWSPIRNGEDRIAIGDKVSEGDFDDENEFQALIEAGAIRPRKHPEDIGPYESVRERNVRLLKEKMDEAAEAGYDVPLTEEEAESQAPEEDKSASTAADREVSRKKT